MQNNVTRAQYVGAGPVLPGETSHQALGRNALYTITHHMFMSAAPGHGFEDEPTNAAEKASQHTVQSAARNASLELQDGQQDGAPAYSFTDSVSQIRSAMRPAAGRIR